jgi:hypothetical protein
MIQELSRTWSAELQLAASAYMADHRITPEHVLRADAVLMLLRINSAEALERVRELAGKPITRCPTGMPPWPPRPVAAVRREPRVSRVAPNPCLPATDMHRRYGLVKVGMSRQQLISRGCQPRDIRIWQSAGHVSFTPPS